jgi:predicted lipoprotein
MCAKPSPETLAAARTAARRALLSFGRVEPVRFGPITQKKRLDRLLFYPDAHGIVSKQTAKLLAKQDEADIEPRKLAGASVAVQGFGALDAVLYGPGSEALATNVPEAGFRCRYARALALDIAQIADETHSEWGADFGRTWLNPGPDNKAFLSAKETTQALYRAYVTQLEVLRLQRLSSLGGSDVKPSGALLPHSGLALPFVLAGVEGERAILGGNGFTAPDLASNDREKSAVEMLGSVETDLEFALRAGEAAVAMAPDPLTDVKARERLTPMLLSLKNAEDIGRAALGELTGQTLGFNSLDGD